MSIDYEAHLAVGFSYTPEDLSAVFEQTFGETSHTEPRYDTHTGDRLPDAVVIDEEGGKFLCLPGGSERHSLEDYDGFDTFIDELCERVGASYSTEENANYGETYRVVIGPPLDDYQEVSVSSVQKKAIDLQRIGAELESLGLPRRELVVAALLSAY